MSGSTPTSPSSSLKSIMYISGMSDTVIGYNGPGIGSIVCPPNPAPAVNVATGYQQSPGAPVIKRLVGISGGGHLVPTDLCQKNAQGRNAVQEAQASGVCGVNTAVIIGLPALFDCGTIDMATGIKAVNYASTAALEETLHCRNRSAQFSSIEDGNPANRGLSAAAVSSVAASRPPFRSWSRLSSFRRCDSSRLCSPCARPAARKP